MKNWYVLFVGLCLGQVVYGQMTIQGSIYDVEGRFPVPIQDAQVKVLGTTYETVSDAQGFFTIQDVAPEIYLLEIAKAGYFPAIREVDVRKREIYSVGVKLLPRLQQEDYESIQSIQRLPRKSLWVPQSLSIYQADQVKWTTPLHTAELLAQSPGVWQTKHVPGSNGIQIRGLSGSRIGLVMNGVRLRTGFQSFDQSQMLDLIDPNLLAHAEVIRGAGAVPFAGNAMGGAVNLNTHQPSFTGDCQQVHGSLIGQVAGPLLQQKLVGQVSLHRKKVAASAAVGQTWQGDYLGGRDFAPLPNSSFQTQQATFSTRIRLTPRQELSFFGYHATQKDAPGEGHRLSLLPQQSYPKQGFQLVSATYTLHSDNKWARQFRIIPAWQQWQQQVELQLEEAGPIQQFQERNLTTSTTFELESEPFSLWHALTGIDYDRNEMAGTASSFIPNNGQPQPIPTRIPEQAMQSNLSLYTYHAVDVLKLRLSFGGRTQARIDGIGSKPGRFTRFLPVTWMGHVAVMYPLTPDYQIYVSSQSSRRLPNLFDYNYQGAIPQGFGVAPDTLGTEQAISSEIGIKARTERFIGSLGLFRTDFTDYIDWIPGRLDGAATLGELPIYTRDNIGDAFIQGIEAQLEVPVNQDMSFYGSLSYLYGRDETRDQPLSRIAPLNSRLGIRIRSQYGIWSSLEWRHANPQVRQGLSDLNDPRSFDSGTMGWDVVDFMVGYDFRWGYMTLGVKNLLNETYFTHGSGLSAPGRIMVFAVRLGF